MSAFATVALVLLAVALGLYVYLRRVQLKVIPSIIGAPHLLGGEPHVLWGSLNPQEAFFSQVHRSYLKNSAVKFARFHVLFVPTLLVFDPKNVRQILATENYPKSEMFYSVLRAFLGDGLICNTGTK